MKPTWCLPEDWETSGRPSQPIPLMQHFPRGGSILAPTCHYRRQAWDAVRSWGWPLCWLVTSVTRHSAQRRAATLYVLNR